MRWDFSVMTDDQMIRELDERTEQRKQEMVEQQTGFDLGGTSDAPELPALQARRDRLASGKPGGKTGFNKSGLGSKRPIGKRDRGKS
jgi:hypothetical protein